MESGMAYAYGHVTFKGDPSFPKWVVRNQKWALRMMKDAIRRRAFVIQTVLSRLS
jgi:hypothetical protein